MIDLNDLHTWSNEDVEAARIALTTESERRNTIATAEAKMNSLVQEYSKASGRKDGDDWVQPLGAHDSYPLGSITTHEGKQWISLMTGNVWEPGSSGWREYVEPEGGRVPEYSAPSGAHDAYMVGDRVSYIGTVFESMIDSNVYSPVEYPNGWVEVLEDDDTPPVDVGPSAWVQPTGAHDAYNSGDKVTFEGVVYESVLNGNTYSPSAYPAGWKTV